jgi:UDP-glucuronate decarboxylase
MRVLITGGYGFIGSFVGEMFAMEGHEVHIVDNLSTGSKDHLEFKHVFYQANVEDPICEEIFKKCKFDAVIHLAAQVNVAVSMEDPYKDTKANVLGLINMLRLAEKYKADKFVFASSAAVYGLNEEMPLDEESVCHPVSPYGMNKWIGEMYCQKWNEIFGLSTVCYRFSNVYGPRQGTMGEGGVVSIFSQRIMDGKELIVYGDGEQTRDFIYVQDLAEAIYLGVKNNLSGVYNLSTNTGVSVNQLIETIGGLAEVHTVKYENEREGDIKHSRLDNSKIKAALEWEPFHSYQDGLEKTYHWFKDYNPGPVKQEEEKKRKMPEWLDRFKSSHPYLMNIGIFLLMLMMSMTVNVHYYLVDYQLVYIILTAFLLGRFQSILSVGTAILWYVTENILLGRDLITLLMDPGSLVQISVYLLVAFTIRYVMDKMESLLSNYRNEANAMKDKYHLLNKEYEDIIKVKEELQSQILYTENSVGTVYKMMADLTSLDPQEIYHSSIKIVENLMKTNEVAFYTYNPSINVLVLQKKSKHFDCNQVVMVEQEEGYMDVIHHKKLFVNKSMKKNSPSLILPVHVKGTVTGVICVNGLSFDQLSLFYINMLDIISNLVSSSLSCAYKHQIVLGKKGR